MHQGRCVGPLPCLPSSRTENGRDVTANGIGGEDGQQRERPALAADTRVAVSVPDFGSFLRQVFPEVRGAGDGVLGNLATRSPNGALLRRDYETAFTLLQRASDAVPALLRQCQQLETEIGHVRAEAQAAVQDARGETQQWQQVALAMKMHIEESEHQIAFLRKRLAAAEERLQEGQSLTQAAEQQASLAIGITTLFHDKIIDAFGVGSAAHVALDTLAQGGMTPELPGKPRG